MYPVIKLFAGGVTAVQLTWHMSLAVSSSYKTGFEGIKMAQMVSGFDLGPSPIKLTEEIEMLYLCPVTTPELI